MSHRSSLKIMSIIFAALTALSAIFLNASGGFGIFVRVLTLCVLAVWAFTILRCFLRGAVPPGDREFEALVLASVVALLLNSSFSDGIGIAAFVIEAAAAVFLVISLIRDRRKRA